MRPARIVVSLAVMSLLAGCASTGGASLQSQSTYFEDVDWVRMTQITRDAERRGHRVLWVNPPQKPLSERRKDEAATGS